MLSGSADVINARIVRTLPVKNTILCQEKKAKFAMRLTVQWKYRKYFEIADIIRAFCGQCENLNGSTVIGVIWVIDVFVFKIKIGDYNFY